MRMKKAGIIVAMQKELGLIGPLPGTEGVQIRTVLSGMGKVNAAVATLKLIMEFRPDFILNLGAAGSLDPDCVLGTTVLGARTSYHDVWCGAEAGENGAHGIAVDFDADPGLLEKAASLLPGARVGRIVTGDQFFISEEEDRRQKTLYPDALAADMESAAIAQTCQMEGVPFLSIRVISDIHSDAGQAESYASFWDGASSPAGEAFRSIRRIIPLL